MILILSVGGVGVPVVRLAPFSGANFPEEFVSGSCSFLARARCSLDSESQARHWYDSTTDITDISARTLVFPPLLLKYYFLTKNL
jgi:hypothetical protein